MAELAPITLEGWYALHQMYAVDWAALRGDPRREAAADEVAALLRDLIPGGSDGGWTGAYRLVGSGGDLMLIHFRPTLDELADVQLRLRRSAAGAVLHLEYDYTSVTETGLYQATAEAASQAPPGSARFGELVRETVAAERASPHVQTRLYPEIPEAMRYVSFYPMSKRRVHPDNWYALPISDRSRMMRDHGLTARRYAQRIFQVITGSVGLDDWEWGVTLFAADPLEFKRVVTDLRFDEASSRYAEFGSFFTGLRIDPEGIRAMLAGD